MIAFLIWLVTGIAFIGLGFYCFFSHKKAAFGFWANADMFPVQDVKAYNRALGKLWFWYGLVFILLGLPLLTQKQNVLIILPILGASAEAICAMAVYVTKIEPKYRTK